LFLIRSRPFGHLSGLEALEAVLATSVFDQQITLLYMDEGVYQLLDRQDAGPSDHSSVSKTIAALHLYDVNRIFVCTRSLAERGLTSSDLLKVDGRSLFKSLNTEEIRNLVDEQDRVLGF